MKLLKLILTTIILISTNQVWAAISPQTELFWNEKIPSINPITQKDIAQILPINMTATNNESKVLRIIVDNSIQTFLRSDAVKNSTFGKASKKMQQKLKADIEIKKNNPSEVTHKFGLNMQPLQQLARLTYGGYFDGQLRYELNNHDLSLECKRKISSQTSLSFQKKWTKFEALDFVQFHWQW